MSERVTTPSGRSFYAVSDMTGVCPECQGEGHFDSCFTCGNRGYLIDQDHPDCPTCGGRGVVSFGLPSNGPDPCPDCASDNPDTPPFIQNCPQCYGHPRGECPFCGSRGPDNPEGLTASEHLRVYLQGWDDSHKSLLYSLSFVPDEQLVAVVRHMIQRQDT